jgi:hypothetical protein
MWGYRPVRGGRGYDRGYDRGRDYREYDGRRDYRSNDRDYGRRDSTRRIIEGILR